MIDPTQALCALILSMAVIVFAAILICLALDDDDRRAKSRR